MYQEEIGDLSKAGQGIMFVGADRFVREVAARGDHGSTELLEENVVKRCIGEHDAEVGIARGH
jgi:hypothetical protein